MLRFWTGLFGPIFAKEMVETGRRRRYFLFRVIILTAVLIGTWLIWREEVGDGVFSRHIVHHTMRRAVNKVFQITSNIQLAAVLLLVPPFLCGVIAEERQRNTLDSLFITTLSDRDIVLGKLASRLFIVLQLVFCVLPVLFLTAIFGSLDFERVLRTYASLLLLIVVLGAMSIYFTSRSFTPLAAILRTYWWAGLWFLVLPRLSMFIAERTLLDSFSQYSYSIIVGVGVMMVCPIGPFLASDPDLYEQVNTGSSWWYPAMFIFPLCISCLFIVRATTQLRIDPKPVKKNRRWRLLLFSCLPLVDRIARRYREEIARGISLERTPNPLLWRARICRTYDRDGFLGRLQLGVWFLLVPMVAIVVTYDGYPLQNQHTARFLFGLAWVTIGFLAAIVSSNSFVRERKSGFLDQILSTQLTVDETVAGTLWSIWWHLLPICLLAPITFFFLLVTSDVEFEQLCVSFFTGVLWFQLVTITGTACSVKARSIYEPLIFALSLPFVATVYSTWMSTFREVEVVGVLAVWMLLFVFSRWLFRTFSSPVTIGIHLIVVHLVFVQAATCWFYPSNSMDSLFDSSNPIYWIIEVLSANRHDNRWGFSEKGGVLVRYWAALILNMFWIRFWLVRNFDQLVGRVSESAPKGLGSKHS